MKPLTVFAFALLLFTVNAGAMAGGKGYGKKHGNQHGNQHYEQRGHKYGNHHNGRHRYNYNRRHNYRHYRPFRGGRYYGGYYRPNYYYPSYLGAALIGSAITYSLYHTHNGAYCYDSHGNDSYRRSSGSEVVGCHRMERQPDGSQRRVEVPMSQCN